ncbi:MAG: plasmid stabilization protein [Sphingomonas taxi]|uniref:Plasmid stabilization protein n=1 Tax=Sphingomonas taxi TaxID=1549858 RepID=A0A2W5QXL8_9SPHN|nr:MAG: plasmid stabilization protein [Sphingomonas taxi]
MKVVISSRARDDLDQIAAWIARDHPERAVSHNDELVDACIALGDYPRVYPRWPHHSAREIRRVNHNDHVIFYEVRATDVHVLTIVHGARNLTPLTDAL